MIEVKVKEWGNSMGIIIPKHVINEMNIKSGDSILVNLEKKENPLKELFGFGKGKKLTSKALLESRRLLESKYL